MTSPHSGREVGGEGGRGGREGGEGERKGGREEGRERGREGEGETQGLQMNICEVDNEVGRKDKNANLPTLHTIVTTHLTTVSFLPRRAEP